jgi:hypothetical protein
LITKNFFAGIRILDKGADYILAAVPPRKLLRMAIFDRLYQAAGSQTIVVE